VIRAPCADQLLAARRRRKKSASKAKRPLPKPRASSRSLTSTTTATSSTFAASLFPRRPTLAQSPGQAAAQAATRRPWHRAASAAPYPDATSTGGLFVPKPNRGADCQGCGPSDLGTTVRHRPPASGDDRAGCYSLGYSVACNPVS